MLHESQHAAGQGLNVSSRCQCQSATLPGLTYSRSFSEDIDVRIVKASEEVWFDILSEVFPVRDPK